MDHMSYSVVIPFFNNHAEVFRAILSIFEQSIPPKLIIIVDDASIEPFSLPLAFDSSSNYSDRLLVLTHASNQGVANARNTGISACLHMSINFIAFCDADDAWHPHKMQLQLPLFCHESILAVACSLHGSQPYAGFRPHQVSTLSRHDLLRRNYIQPSTLVVRASALSRLGGFPVGRRHAEEGDLYNRIAELGSILFLSTPLVYYDTRSGSTTEAPSLLPVSPGRLSHNVVRMYSGNLFNIFGCYRRGTLSLPWALFYSALLLARFFARTFFILLGSLLWAFGRRS